MQTRHYNFAKECVPVVDHAPLLVVLYKGLQGCELLSSLEMVLVISVMHHDVEYLVLHLEKRI